MRLKIPNGTLVTPTGSARGEIVCRDGIIEQVGLVAQGTVDEVIDASACLVYPGFIDPHVTPPAAAARVE